MAVYQFAAPDTAIPVLSIRFLLLFSLPSHARKHRPLVRRLRNPDSHRPVVHCRQSSQDQQVSDHQPQLIGSPASSRVDEVETIIRGILDRVSTWARYSDTTTFFRQNEIKMGILECYRELSSCSDRFIASLSMLSSSESRLREEARRRDHEQLMDILANLKQELRRGVPPIAMELPPQVEELVRPGEQPGIATGVQQSISQTLPSPSLRPSDCKRARHQWFMLYSSTVCSGRESFQER
ncbi:hypothetical protein BC834DRAFT_364932 [Gloeopeniophorella convolvens]|nr:hypothetical protein BC834DRAFT_364932 [Gloeopeniophorella convolvens]